MTHGSRWVSLTGVYEPDNIFARIIRGEAPAAKVFEDAATIAFLDVFPQSEGHTLVIPKEGAARNLLDADPAILAPLMRTVQRVGRALITTLNPDGLIVTQFNGQAAGQTVFHLHVHLIPRWRGRELARHAGGAMANADDLARLAARIAAAVVE